MTQFVNPLLQANPLRQYFRQPAIYLKLPSGGTYWPTHALEKTPTGELPVLPMTAIDEITYRTPDALFNGQAVVSVIQSCLPQIKDAWSAPVIDINAILVAIRIASYGHELEIGTTCPACTTETEYAVDLRSVLDRLAAPDFSKTIQHGDLEIIFQPINYRSQHETNTMQFEEQRMIQMIPNSDLPDEEKLARLNGSLKRITELTVSALKWSIGSIRTPQAIVTDPNHIEEFLNNCDRNLFGQIRDRVIELRQVSELRPLHIKCDNCGHEYEQPLTLDMASFFATAS
jgi:hypothetical protein